MIDQLSLALKGLSMVPVSEKDLETVELWYYKGFWIRKQYLVNLSTGIAFRNYYYTDGSHRQNFIIQNLIGPYIVEKKFASKKELEIAISKFKVRPNLDYLGNLWNKQTRAKIEAMYPFHKND